MHMRHGLRITSISLIAISLTLTAGWALMRDIEPLVYLGYVGGFPMLLITGVHGGTSVQNAMGGCVFVVVNFAFYFGLLYWIEKIWSKCRAGEKKR